MPIGRRWIEALVLASILIVYASPGRAETDGDEAATASARSAAVADVERMEAQDRRIEQLETTLRTVQDRLDSADEGPAQGSSDSTGDDADGEAVDRSYVDRRIQDFEDAPTSRFMVSGYGTVGLVDLKNGETAFEVGFNPGFHFRMSEKLHLNAELEMGYEVEDEAARDQEFEIDLEFAQFDYLATDWLVISGGRFLTPFNTFGQRLHPAWINKLASLPPIYGGGHGGGGFIPVLKTIGGMLSGGTSLWNDDAKVNYALFVGNGSTGEGLSDPPTEDELLDVDFNNTPDLDDGVMVGGRLGMLPIRNLELGVSYMTSDPDDARFHMWGVDGWYNYKGLELRGEFAYLERNDSGIKANVRGYWLQAAYRLNRIFTERDGFRGVANRLEPVVRFGQVSNFSEKNRDQLAIGLDYWLYESAPLKISYEFNYNDGGAAKDRLSVSFAYGF